MHKNCHRIHGLPYPAVFPSCCTGQRSAGLHALQETSSKEKNLEKSASGQRLWKTTSESQIPHQPRDIGRVTRLFDGADFGPSRASCSLGHMHIPLRMMLSFLSSLRSLQKYLVCVVYYDVLRRRRIVQKQSDRCRGARSCSVLRITLVRHKYTKSANIGIKRKKDVPAVLA